MHPGPKGPSRALSRSVDWILVLGTAAVAGLGFLGSLPVERATTGVILLASAVLGTAAVVAVALRRRWPIGASALAATAMAIALVPELRGALIAPVLAFLVCTFAVAAYSTVNRTAGLVGSAMCWIAVLVLSGSGVFIGLFGLVLFGGVLGWAFAVRSREQYVIALRQQLRTAERERELTARQAVLDERARMARDIHDVVSHSLTIVAAQAAGAQRAARRDPEAATAALGVIAETARSALADMRSMLALLREPDGSRQALNPRAVDSSAGGSAYAPAPTLADVPALVERVRSSGLAVGFDSEGVPYDLAPGVELVAHRVVQEGLTNALRYGSGEARLGLVYRPDALVIDISNPLPAEGAPRPIGSGSGLRGLSDRLTAIGGDVQVEAGPDLWRVTATIPRPELEDEAVVQQ
ncbi:MAG: hypothetical protein RLZ55_1542 [Actinomycetota bacterium]